MMLLYPTHKDVIITLKNPDYLAEASSEIRERRGSNTRRGATRKYEGEGE